MQKQNTNKDNYALYLVLRKEWVIYHDQVLIEFDKFLPDFENLNYDKFYEYRDMYQVIYDDKKIIYSRSHYKENLDYQELVMFVKKMLDFLITHFLEILSSVLYKKRRRRILFKELYNGF